MKNAFPACSATHSGDGQDTSPLWPQIFSNVLSSSQACDRTEMWAMCSGAP